MAAARPRGLRQRPLLCHATSRHPRAAAAQRPRTARATLPRAAARSRRLRTRVRGVPGPRGSAPPAATPNSSRPCGSGAARCPSAHCRPPPPAASHDAGSALRQRPAARGTRRRRSRDISSSLTQITCALERGTRLGDEGALVAEHAAARKAKQSRHLRLGWMRRGAGLHTAVARVSPPLPRLRPAPRRQRVRVAVGTLLGACSRCRRQSTVTVMRRTCAHRLAAAGGSSAYARSAALPPLQALVQALHAAAPARAVGLHFSDLHGGAGLPPSPGALPCPGELDLTVLLIWSGGLLLSTRPPLCRLCGVCGAPASRTAHTALASCCGGAPVQQQQRRACRRATVALASRPQRGSAPQTRSRPARSRRTRLGGGSCAAVAVAAGCCADRCRRR